MIQFRVMDKPSNSKGWGRYAAGQDGRRVIESKTGNEWVSSDKGGEAEQGSQVTLRMQVMLRVGKDRSRREEITTQAHTLVVEDGATCEVELRPGSQGMRLMITGARIAE